MSNNTVDDNKQQMRKIPFEKSFASHPHSSEWDYNSNEMNPEDVSKNSHIIYQFKCKECSHTFKARLSDVSKGGWCPYCSVPCHKLCENLECEKCFEKSFASHPHSLEWDYTSNKITPREALKKSNIKYWFKCKECSHSFGSTLHDVSKGSWCAYCGNKKLCENLECEKCYDKSFASHPRSLEWDYTSNKIIPRKTFKNSNTEYQFKCKECNHTFKARLNSVSKGSWCPKCPNKTEEKFYEIMSKIYPDIKYQHKLCKNPETGRYFPYDFCILNLKIIIEIDGEQHFNQISNWKCPEDTRKRDLYKMNYANENGFSVIRILQKDILLDTYNWSNEIKKQISRIQENSFSQCIFICRNNEYNIFCEI